MMQVYMVGGAVRDKLLNRPIKDKDFVVVGSTPDTMRQAGFIQVGADFPVFLHPQTKAEYALARTERKSGKGYKGFEVYAAPDVTLEHDLLRRDLTINAMAIEVVSLYDDTLVSGDIIDPYGGVQDIQNRILRHVSTAFSEDPLRVLRIARLYSRFYSPVTADNFTIAPDTLQLIQHIIKASELAHLTAERVWVETSRAIMQAAPQAYFDCLHDIGALPALLPQLATVWRQEPMLDLVPTALELAANNHLSLSQHWAILMLSFAPHALFDKRHFNKTTIDNETLINETSDKDTTCKEPFDSTGFNFYIEKSISPPNELTYESWLGHIKDCSNLLKVPKLHTQFAILYATCFYYLDNMEQLDASQLLDFIQLTKANKNIESMNALITVHHTIEISKQQLTLLKYIKAYQSVTMHDIDSDLKGSDIGAALNHARVSAIKSNQN